MEIQKLRRVHYPLNISQNLFTCAASNKIPGNENQTEVQRCDLRNWGKKKDKAEEELFQQVNKFAVLQNKKGK